MSVTLNIGLSDLSTELGENTVKTDQSRITHYNNAVIEFFSERKWPFAIKKDSTTLITLTGISTYSILAITDMRKPGGIKFIEIGSSTFKPIDYEDRNNAEYDRGNWFYMDPEDENITFKGSLTAGLPIIFHYWFIPARLSTLTDSFPLPDRYRKAVAYLASAYTQWSRYLSAQGTEKYNLYVRAIKKTTLQQSERHTNKPRNIKHFLAYRGFRRIYR